MKPIRIVVVGIRGIGAWHAKTLHELPEFDLIGICDLNEETLASLASEIPGVHTSTDFEAQLRELKPEAVVVSTNHASHAALVRMAWAAGVSGVYCEKPMAVDLVDAREMVATAERVGGLLVVNHQRRTYPAVQKMRELLDAGAIGKVEVIRVSGGGDILSDGTHGVDSLRFLAGDSPVKWVFGQIGRNPVNPDEPKGGGFDISGGYRFGHPVEDAAMALVQFQNGIRGELFWGKAMAPGRYYQDYEALGTDGRLWRPTDGQQPALRLQRESGWAQIPLDSELDHKNPFRWFADSLRTGKPHPMNGQVGLDDMEVVTAIYESARRHRFVTLPLEVDRFPLDSMIVSGELS